MSNKTEQNNAETVRTICGMDMEETTRGGTRRMNHSGTLIKRKHYYLAKWMVAGKVYTRSTGTSDKNKALRKLDEYTRSLREDSLLATLEALKAQIERLQARRTRDELPLGSLWDVYAETIPSDITPGTIKGYESATRNMVAWMHRHGARNAEGITAALAGEYLREEQSKLGKASWNNRLVLYKKIWRTLSKLGKAVEADAWEGYEKQKGCKHDSIRKALTPEEISRVTKAAEKDADLHLVMVIGTYTGMRLSDAAQLKWSDVDFASHKISVVPIKTKRHGTRVVIPMHKVLEAELLKARESSTGEYVSAKNAKEYTTGTLNGKTSDLFRACGFETSITDEDGKTKLVYGFHSLRHSLATLLANTNVPITVIQQILGHSAASMSLHYCHADEEKAREGISALKVA